MQQPRKSLRVVPLPDRQSGHLVRRAGVVAAICAVVLAGCSSSKSEPGAGGKTDAVIASTLPSGPTTLSAEQTLKSESSKVIISGLLRSLNGGVDPDAKDIDCVASKISPEQIESMMASALGGGGLEGGSIQPVLTAVFSCNPKGLAETLSSGLGVLPADLSPAQQSCAALATSQAVLADPEVLTKLTQSASLSALSDKQRTALAADLRKNISGCSLDAAVVDKIVTQISG